eukprot:2177452-Pyramimonas_sp.AAC.1
MEEDILMLNNGCLCCTVRSDLVEMLTKLAKEKKGMFDHVLIETTGLANPAPIIQVSIETAFHSYSRLVSTSFPHEQHNIYMVH